MVTKRDLEGPTRLHERINTYQTIDRDTERVCINVVCGWKGRESETVHPKHVTLDRLCPICYEVTE